MYATVVAQPLSPPQLTTLPLGTALTFSFAHSGSVDWAKGEENTFTLRLSTKSRDERQIGSFLLKSTLTSAIGSTYREDSIPEHRIRVTDNELFAEQVLTYPVQWKVDPYVAASARTAITESFTYSGARRTRTAGLWDPVTSQQSWGFTWGTTGKDAAVSTRLGFALQQLRASLNVTTTDDVKTKEVIEAYKAQSGIECVTELFCRADSTMNLTARLGMFGEFDDLKVWTVRFESETKFTILKSLAITWTLNVVHDVRQSLRTQFRESMMVGVVTTIGGE